MTEPLTETRIEELLQLQEDLLDDGSDWLTTDELTDLQGGGRVRIWAWVPPGSAQSSRVDFLSGI